ncbi:hypothetical protein [Bradyrhizobium pachyrhizi]|uniref:hypothetical protein n=1 Tax=Bradyrhizobium pachyrhizi TaxID=280333 RepID=UPI003D35C3C6
MMSRATGAFCGLPNTSKISGRLSGLAVSDAAELWFEFVVIDAMHDTGSPLRRPRICEAKDPSPSRRRERRALASP